MTRTVEVELTGCTPLLMHAFPLVAPEALEKRTPEEQAEIAAYRDTDGTLYIPAINIQRSLIAGAAYCKGKGRTTLQKPAAACLMVTPERVSLGTKEYTIDSRAVVVPATKGRVIRHRPRLDDWACKFTIEFDDTLISPNELRAIVDNACQRVGFLDFRPEKKGPFGRAMVTRWELTPRP